MLRNPETPPEQRVGVWLVTSSPCLPLLLFRQLLPSLPHPKNAAYCREESRQHSPVLSGAASQRTRSSTEGWR